MMNAYFNELSFTHYADRAGAKTGLLELIECLKRLDEFSIKNIKRSQQTDKKCLVGNESYLRMLNDETLIDKDMKSVLINRMETLEPEDELVDKYLVVSMKHNSQDCKGLGWASSELENTITLSLHPEVWKDCSYNVAITRLGDAADEYKINASCRSIAAKRHIEIHREFLSSLRTIPCNGKVLALILTESFPNLTFSRQAKNQVKELKNEEAITQIYFRLQDLQRVATTSKEHCSPQYFTTKASPESDTREKLFASRMTFLFENGISYLCSWHLRFTPGAGRIHFYHEPTEKKIYIGYIGAKIQAE